MGVRHVITRGFGTAFDVGESQIKYVVTAGFDLGIPPEPSPLGRKQLEGIVDDPKIEGTIPSINLKGTGR